jgi:hypothetical protein
MHSGACDSGLPASQSQFDCFSLHHGSTVLLLCVLCTRTQRARRVTSWNVCHPLYLITPFHKNTKGLFFHKNTKGLFG